MRGFIDSFRLNNEIFSHRIFCTEDDRIECQDASGNVRLVYDTSCGVWIDNQRVGKTSMRDSAWYYLSADDTVRIDGGTDLLELEVLVSKHYLTQAANP